MTHAKAKGNKTAAAVTNVSSQSRVEAKGSDNEPLPSPSLLGWLLIGPVRMYQWFISPLLGKNCRFTPSCSNYFIQAVQKYGPLRGAIRGVLRICRCHPFHPGGHDPP